MRKLIISVIVIGLLAVSCSASGRWIQKNGQSKEDFWDDNTKCHEYAEWALYHRAAVGTGTAFQPLVERRHFNDCMKAKGYLWEATPTRPY